ncbi:MAG: acyl carrier protein [Akkermansia sp.]|nr:acyl carrier protein [Akkermansia sp.]
MTEELFLNMIAEALELDSSNMHIDDDFRTYEEWDSLTFLALLTLMNEEFGLQLSIDTFNGIRTWKDLHSMLPE